MARETTDVRPVTGVEPVLGLLLGMLEDGTKKWRREMGEVTDEAILWQPFPGGHSIGLLILHMADVEAFWLHEVAAGQTRTDAERARLLSVETRQYQVQWPLPPERPLAWFFEQHDAIREKTREILWPFTSAEQICIRLRDGEGFTLRWLLHHVINHEAYHGGQAVLLSLMHGAAR